MNSNGPFWQGATGVWHAHQAPVVAILTAVLIAFAARRWRVRADAAGALGVAVGWAALLAPTTIHAVFAPRSLPEHLMFVGLMGVLAAIVRPYAPGRLNKAVPLAVAMLAGWWLARSAPGRPEFWRVGLVITIAALGLARIVGTEASRASTAAVAMAGALLAEGAPSIGRRPRSCPLRSRWVYGP